MKASSSLVTIVIIIAVLAIVGFNGCSTYNGFVNQSEALDQTWAQVQNQYQRRFDLIPNLVETVKGYAAHESQTYENVTRARAGLETSYNQAKSLENNDMADPENFEQYTNSQADLAKAISIYVNAVHEAYPDLKANEQFLNLQTQLEGTENRIATARNDYTKAVQEYNVKIRRFPANIWAGMFGFSARPQYKADEAAQTAPKVSF